MDTCLVSDAGDEGLDVELCGTALLAGCIGTLETAASLPQRSPLTQRGVLDIIKVVHQVLTRLCSGETQGRWVDEATSTVLTSCPVAVSGVGCDAVAYRAGLVLVPLPVLFLALGVGSGLETGVRPHPGVEGEEALQEETHGPCGQHGQQHKLTRQLQAHEQECHMCTVKPPPTLNHAVHSIAQ